VVLARQLCVASFCPELHSGRLECSGIGAYALRRIGASTGLRIPQKRIFHTCVHYGAYPWNGIFGEGSISCRYMGGPSLPQLPQQVEIRDPGVVWNFNKRPICVTLFVLRSRHPRSPVKHADLHDNRQIHRGCDKLLRHTVGPKAWLFRSCWLMTKHHVLTIASISSCEM
jgi:hypothetical protein